MITVYFERFNQSRRIAEALRYFNKDVCQIFGSGMKKCAMNGKHTVITTWECLEDAKDAARYLHEVQEIGCLRTCDRDWETKI